eukprot:597102-Pyramimonas_sp.AAC.1
MSSRRHSSTATVCARWSSWRSSARSSAYSDAVQPQFSQWTSTCPVGGGLVKRTSHVHKWSNRYFATSAEQ